MKKRTLIAAALAAVAGPALVAGTAGARSSASASGAGSTFVAPLVALWSQNYKSAHVSYNPIGSGGGIQAITNKQVDFGGSDAPLTPDQKKACPCVQIPWALSATSVPYHVAGLRQGLKITGRVLANIYLGKVAYWDAKPIKKLNRKRPLPHLKITPIFRSDASGTTYNFTDYLSKVSKAFRHRVGNSTQVNFPVGVGGKGSSGVSAVLQRTNGGITYVDVAYSLKNHFRLMQVKNRAGKFTRPGIRAIQSAASLVKKVPGDNEMHIVDPPKKKNYANAYPICTYTYVILQKRATSSAAKRFVHWALTKGQKVAGAKRLLFVPIGKKVQKASLKTLKKVH